MKVKNNILKKMLVINTAVFVGLCFSNYASFADSGDYSSNAIDFYNKGVEYFNSNNYSGAISQFEQALKLDPSNVDARINLAGAYINRGAYYLDKKINLGGAANDFRKAIFYLKYDENLPDNFDRLKQNLDIATSNLKNTLTYQKIQLTPRSHLKIAKELRGQGGFKESVVEFNEALADKNLQLESYEALGDVMRVLQKDYKAVEYYEKALALNPENGVLHLKIARALQKLDNIDNAVKEYNFALDLDPGNVEIVSALENLWRKKLQENPNDAVAHMNLGVVLQKKKDFDGAMAQYKAAEMLDPANSTLRLNLGTLFQAQGNLPMAIQAYDSIIQITPTDPKVHYYRATALRDMGNISGAIDEFQIVLKLDPNDYVAKKAIFETVKKLNNPEEALSILQYFAQNNPNDAFAQYNYAYELHTRKKIDDALTYYQKAILINPSLLDGYLNIASIYREKGQIPEAISVLQNALKVDPDNQKVKTLISQVKEGAAIENYKQAVNKQNQGDYQGAIEDYKKIILDGGADSDTYVSLGSAYQATSNFDEAIKSYNKAIELDKNNASAFYYLGTAYYSRKNYTKANEYYQKALVLDPANSDIKAAIDDIKVVLSDNVLDKGINELNAKRYLKALEVFNYALKNNPNNAYAYYYRGMTYDSLKKTTLAINDYKKSVEKSNDLNVAYYSLAVDYDLLKNYVEAKKAYQKFVNASTDQNDQYVKYAKQRLKSLK